MNATQSTRARNSRIAAMEYEIDRMQTELRGQALTSAALVNLQRIDRYRREIAKLERAARKEQAG